MKGKKYFRSLFLIVMSLCLIIMAGCANSGSESSNSSNEENGDEVTITFMSRWPPFNKLLTEKLIPEFEDSHPNINVKQLSFSSHGNYVKALQSAVNGNNLPDFFSNHPKMPTYQLQELGVLHKLNDIIGDRKNEFEDGMWTPSSTTMNGDTYAFPIFSNKKDTMLMFYNKKVLKEAGLTKDDIPKTWDELVNVSKKIKKNTDAYGTYLELNYWTLKFLVGEMASTISPEVAYSVDTKNFNYHTGKYNYNSKGTIETIKFLKSLVDKELDEPSDISRSKAQGPGVLASGKAAFLFSGAFAASEMQQEGFDNFGVASLPTKNGKPKHGMYTGGTTKGGFHVAKNTKHYKEVKTFFKFLMNKGYSKMVKNGVNYPPIPEVVENTKSPDSPSWKAFTKQDKNYVRVPDPVLNNKKAYKVKAELSGKGADKNIGDVARGYIKGQIEEGELKSTLEEMTDKQNQAFKKALNKVQDNGVDIEQSAWKFPEWEPGKSYKK